MERSTDSFSSQLDTQLRAVLFSLSTNEISDLKQTLQQMRQTVKDYQFRTIRTLKDLHLKQNAVNKKLAFVEQAVCQITCENKSLKAELIEVKGKLSQEEKEGPEIAAMKMDTDGNHQVQVKAQEAEDLGDGESLMSSGISLSQKRKEGPEEAATKMDSDKNQVEVKPPEAKDPGDGESLMSSVTSNLVQSDGEATDISGFEDIFSQPFDNDGDQFGSQPVTRKSKDIKSKFMVVKETSSQEGTDDPGDGESQKVLLHVPVTLERVPHMDDDDLFGSQPVTKKSKEDNNDC